MNVKRYLRQFSADLDNLNLSATLVIRYIVIRMSSEFRWYWTYHHHSSFYLNQATWSINIQTRDIQTDR